MPEPTTELDLVRRTVRTHTIAAGNNLRAAVAPLRARDRHAAYANTELLHSLEEAERALRKAQRIVSLWGSPADQVDAFAGEGEA